MGVPNLENGTVDVRDVAKAHLLAAFTKHAKGRYIISNEVASFLNMAKLIEKNFPKKYPLPKRIVPKSIIWAIAPKLGLTRKYIRTNVGRLINFNNRKSINELGIAYKSLETALIDQVKQLENDHAI
jgi:nucleoside-diphosphate-sugar epimerase